MLLVSFYKNERGMTEGEWDKLLAQAKRIENVFLTVAKSSSREDVFSVRLFDNNVLKKA